MVRRTPFTIALAAIVLSGSPVSPVWAQVYKYVDENGIVNYTNIAPPTNYAYQTLRFPVMPRTPSAAASAGTKWRSTRRHSRRKFVSRPNVPVWTSP